MKKGCRYCGKNVDLNLDNYVGVFKKGTLLHLSHPECWTISLKKELKRLIEKAIPSEES
jgi:hypothetical protein